MNHLLYDRNVSEQVKILHKTIINQILFENLYRFPSFLLLKT